MPLGIKPLCSSCKTNTSTIWQKGGQGEILCQSCALKQGSGGSGKEDNGQNGNSTNGVKGNGNGNSHAAGPVLRKSSRIRPSSKHKYQVTTKSVATKGKGRRIIYKKTIPLKAPTSVSTVVTGDSVFHDGMYYQLGDVVSLVDHDSSLYYAQLRGFMQDQYGDKSAVITWLLPTQGSPRDHFDPATYILGPEEDLPRRMEFMEFVCHAPSEYFRSQNAPFPTINTKPDLCYIWTSVGPQIQSVPTIDEIFGVKDISNKPIEKEKDRRSHIKEEKVD